MADLPEVEVYDAGVYQLETTDPVIGGVDGKSNAATRNLSNRTNWLKARIDALMLEESMTAHLAALDPHTQYATKAGVQGCVYSHATAGGTADAITASFTPAITALVNGMTLFVVASAANLTTMPTFSPNGLTAHTILKGAGTALSAGDIIAAGHILELKYRADISSWILQNPVIYGADIRLLSSLDYPTIATATNKATVTPSTDAAGGKVALTAGTVIELGKAYGSNGSMSLDVISAFVSPSLAVSSTYYLRAMYVGNVLTFYVQKGIDTDAIPAGLVGTVNGASGGGFDTTVLDMLIAKVVTGTAGTLPTVITLANAKKLSTALTIAGGFGVAIVLAWSRKPTMWMYDKYGSGTPTGFIDADAVQAITALSRSSITISSTYASWVSFAEAYGQNINCTLTLQG